MDSAVDAQGDPVSIEMLRDAGEIPDLWCGGEILGTGEECGGKAWPTALQSTVKSATFAAHHRPGCEHETKKSTSKPGDAGHPHKQGVVAPRWRMRFGAVEQAAARNGRLQPNDGRPGSRTRRYRADPMLGGLDTADDHSWSTMLADLRAGTLPSPLELLLGAKDPVDAATIIRHASDATITGWKDRDLIIWGEVTGVATTKWDSLMLRMKDAADGVAIMVVKNHLQELQISDPQMLVGRHAIAYGRYDLPSSSRWPHVRAAAGALAFNPRVMRRRRG